MVSQETQPSQGIGYLHHMATQSKISLKTERTNEEKMKKRWGKKKDNMTQLQ